MQPGMHTISIAGGKFCLVSNYTELHALTQATRSFFTLAVVAIYVAQARNHGLIAITFHIPLKIYQLKQGVLKHEVL